MSNTDQDLERINRLKHYVNQISIHTSSLKYDLINEIENGNITNTNEIKNYIEEFENKAEYKKIVIHSNLDHTSQKNLLSKLKKEEIITKEQLEQEITEEKKKSDLRRELIKIVKDSNLDNISRRILISKINNNEESKQETYNSLTTVIWIINRQRGHTLKHINWEPYYNFIDKILEEEIWTEEQLNNVIQSELRRTHYRKIIEENYYLDRRSYLKLKSKINDNEIITKEELKKEIRIAERKIDYEKIYDKALDKYDYIDCTSLKKLARTPYVSKQQWNANFFIESEKSVFRIKLIKIVIDSNLDYTSQKNLISKINKEEIITKEQLEQEILKV